MVGIVALAVGYILSQFYRSFLAVLTPDLIADLGATNSQLSTAAGTWFITFALMQFVVGVGLDRYGPRVTASTLMILGAGGGALLFASATAPWMIILAMGLIGVGCSPLLMSPFYIFARTFSAARFAVLASWFVGLGSLGNVVGASPMAIAAEALGWRQVMLVLAAVTVAVAAAIFLLVRDPERLAGEGDDKGGLRGYIDLLKVRALWFIVPITAVNYAPAAGIRGLWSGPYLADVYGADGLLIGQVTLFMALAMVAGNFIYGPLDTIFNSRKWVAFAGNAVATVVFAVLFLNPVAGITLATAAFVLIGLSGSSYGVLMAHAKSFVPSHLTGRGVTLMNFFSIGGVGLIQFITGGIVTSDAVAESPAGAYANLFLFYGAILAASLLIYLFSTDKKPGETAD